MKSPLLCPCSLGLFLPALLALGGVDAHSIHSTLFRDNECLWNRGSLLRLPGRNSCGVPIDDESLLPSWNPWTHHPYCINSTSLPQMKYCVYTNSQFGDRGISVITTPEVASTSRELLVGTLAAPGTAERQKADKTEPFEMVDIPGRGKSLVATRAIRQYDMFLEDQASVMADVAFPGRVRRMQGYELLHHATDQLPHPDSILDLAQSGGGSADVLEDVLRTNSFQFDLAGVSHMALFPRVSVRFSIEKMTVFSH